MSILTIQLTEKDLRGLEPVADAHWLDHMDLYWCDMSTLYRSEIRLKGRLSRRYSTEHINGNDNVLGQGFQRQSLRLSRR